MHIIHLAAAVDDLPAYLTVQTRVHERDRLKFSVTEYTVHGRELIRSIHCGTPGPLACIRMSFSALALNLSSLPANLRHVVD